MIRRLIPLFFLMSLLGQEQPAGGVFRIPSKFPEEKPPAPPKPEEPKTVVLSYTGTPIKLPFSCTDDDITAFGMTCTELYPCPVYAELAGLQPLGSKIFVSGNLHNGATTMYSLLLVSEDGGKTWLEPLDRIKSAGLDKIEFFDIETGWISGGSLLALPRDPFFLLTTDGGRNWRRRPVFGDPHVGTVDQFHFESRTAGALIVDRGQGADLGGRFEKYETMTGGESWMVREVSPRGMRLKIPVSASSPSDWRLGADAGEKAHLIERRIGNKWTTVAAFEVRVGSCKPTVTALPEPILEPLAPPVATPARPGLKKR